jgi:uncharacterized C2H2 Zn-finger protein
VNETLHHCPLCGIDFDAPACSACPLSRGCAMVRCPRCHFEFVEESSLVNFVRRVFSWRSDVSPTR